MKQKLYYLLALTFLLLIGGGTNVVFADANTTLISGITLPSLPSGTYEGGTEVIHKNSNKAVVCDKDGNSVMQASSPGYGNPTAENFTWANAYDGSNDGGWSTTGATWDAPENSIFVGSGAYTNSSNTHYVNFARRCNIRTVRTFAYRFTNCGGVSALVKSQGDTSGAGAVLAVYQVGSSDALTLVDSRTSITMSVDVITVDGLNKDNTYVAYIYGENGSNGELYEIAFLAPPSATAPTFSTNLPATVTVGVGSSKTFTVASSNAVSYQWYKGSSSTANPASDTQLGTGASYTYTAPNAEGTEYIYCVATNENGSTTSNVCTVTVAEFQTVTFGLTRPLTVDATDATKGTMGDNVWNTADDTFTLTEIMGSEVSIDGGNRSYVIDNVTYTAVKSYKKGVNRSSFDEAQYAGYSFVIPDGKKLDITKVDARLSDASDCTWTWKIEVQDADGNTLWNTGDRTTNPKSTTTASISDNSLATKLAGLVSGTYYAKIYFYQGGTTKCNTIDLTFTGNLKDADATAPTVTIASEQTMVKDAANTIASVVQAYPEATAYQWYSCDDDQGNNPVVVEGQTTSTLTVTPSAEGTLYYYLAVTNSAGTTNSNVCTVTVVAEAEFSNFEAILNSGTGSLIATDERTEGNAVPFGISVDNEGNAVRVAEDSPLAFATVSGNWHSNEHGLNNFKTVVKVPGNVKIKLGTCAWGGNVTIKNASNETVATANTNNGACYHQNTSANKVTVYYEGPATTLTIEGGNYVPFISIESVPNLSTYTVTFKNGEETVDTRTVYNDEVEAQAIGTLPEVTAAQGKRFRGWYVASDGSEGKVKTSTVPSSDITYYAVFMDTPVTTAGYYMPNNGLELANVLEYIEETSAASAKIFLKNGTYTLPRGASRHYTHKHSQTSAVLWDGDAYDPITYLKSSNVSFVGQSRDNVVITNNIPNTQEYIFSGQYGNANIYEGIGQSDVIQIDGNVSGLYWQDLTVSTGMEDGYGRDIAIQDKGTNNIYKNVSLHGYQDTWTSNKDNGLYYFEGGVVRGRTDYLCGKGDIYFNGVELRQLKGGYAAVPSKPASVGWVFKDCVINGDEADVDGNYTLGRPWGNGTLVAVFIDTKMNVKPSAIGWNEMSGGWPARFAEYNSFDANGNAISLTGRKTTFADTHQNNPVLTAEEAATYSDMTNMYGNWNPAQYTVQATVSNVKLNGSTLSWEGTSDAYLIEKNGEFVALTSETSYTVSGPGNYTVRAANARGGFGEPAESTAGKVTISYEIGTNTTSFTCTPSTTDDKITFAQVPYTLYADPMALDAKPDLSVKLTCGTADAAAATVTFAVPDGYAFIPYTAKAKVQPVTNNAMVKLTLSDDNNTMSNSAASFKQGSITTSTLTATETKYYTGTVTFSIYCYENGGKGYRLGTPITISGELVEVVTTNTHGNASHVASKALDFSGVEGVKAYIATAADAQGITLAEVTEVPAGTAFVVQATEKAENTYYVPTTTEEVTLSSQNVFEGNATQATATEAGYTYYALSKSKGMFAKVGSSVQSIPAGKAYVKLAANAGNAKETLAFFFGETTGIAEAEEAEAQQGGVRKQLINGRLVIIKGDKRYNAAGAEF